MQAKNTVYLKIKRQASPDSKPYWEVFSLDCGGAETLLSLLIRLGESPGDGRTPVYHEHNCKEEMCGTCAIRVNGKPRMSCSTRVADLPASSQQRPVILEPLLKFPVVRDLTVDRSRMFRGLARVGNWVETDGLFGPPVNYGPDKQLEMYSYSKCINCGVCYDACPRTGKAEDLYMGPSAVARAVTMNDHPLGTDGREKRLESIMKSDGVPKCGKALVCEKVCPKKVPLVRSITRANREIIKKSLHIPGIKRSVE